MAGGLLLDTSGNRLLDASGHRILDDGAGNACCCGPTPTCTACTGAVPFKFRVTISGVAYCSCVISGGGSQLVTGDDVNGTYDLPFNDVCLYAKSFPCNTRVRIYSSSDCTGSPTSDVSASTISVSINISSGACTVDSGVVPNIYISDSVTWPTGTFDCVALSGSGTSSQTCTAHGTSGGAHAASAL